jgi:hypothetical protein
MYDADGAARWSSETPENSFAYLRVENDGNLVIYQPQGPAIWDRFGR